MAINWDPKLKAPPPPVEPQASEKSSAGPAKKAIEPEAIDKPKTLAEPSRSKIHPARQGPRSQPPLFEKEVARLSELLRAKDGRQASAAAEALAMCSSYRMRRSRGARRLALDLCSEVAEQVTEFSGLAKRLGRILAAEGDLHETSARATLRACRALIQIVESQADEETDA